MKDLSPEVENAIDSICLLGCVAVNAYINALRNGESRPEYHSLDSEQRARLLHELQSIMSVYEEGKP